MNQDTNPSHQTLSTPRKAQNSKKHAAKRLLIDQFIKRLLESLRDFDFNELHHQKWIEFEGVTVSVVTHGHNETNPAQSNPKSYSFFQVVRNPHGRRAGSSCWENAGSRKKSSKPQPMHIKYYQHKEDPSWRCQVFLLSSQSHLLNENKFWVSWIFREDPRVAPAVASTELGPPAPFDNALAGIPPSPMLVEGHFSSSRSTQGSAVPPHQPHVQQMQATRPLHSAQNAATPVPGVSDTSPLQRSVNRFPLPATPNASAGNRESPDKPLGRDDNFIYQSPSSVAQFAAPVSPIGWNDTSVAYQHVYQSPVGPESPQSSASATEADVSSPSCNDDEWLNSLFSESYN